MFEFGSVVSLGIFLVCKIKIFDSHNLQETVFLPKLKMNGFLINDLIHVDRFRLTAGFPVVINFGDFIAAHPFCC